MGGCHRERFDRLPKPRIGGFGKRSVDVLGIEVDPVEAAIEDLGFCHDVVVAALGVKHLGHVQQAEHPAGTAEIPSRRRMDKNPPMSHRFDRNAQGEAFGNEIVHPVGEKCRNENDVGIKGVKPGKAQVVAGPSARCQRPVEADAAGQFHQLILHAAAVDVETGLAHGVVDPGAAFGRCQASATRASCFSR